MDTLMQPVSAVRGIGPTYVKRLNALGIQTAYDLIRRFPRAYENRGHVSCISSIMVGTTVSLILTVSSEITVRRTKNSLIMYSFRAHDESGNVDIVFFNSPFVKSVFQVGLSFRFYGKTAWLGKRIAMTSPKYELHVPGIALDSYYPVYSLTKGISSHLYSLWVSDILSKNGSSIPDFLPESVRLKNNLPTHSVAYQNVHFPKDDLSVKTAIRRFAFDEWFAFGLLTAYIQSNRTQTKGVVIRKDDYSSLYPLIPFSLTASQQTAVAEITADMTKEAVPMNRLLVGDVGSGKTVCALFAAFLAVKSGAQVAILAPTEILAIQHYDYFSSVFEKLGFSISLLLGSTKAGEKKKIYEKMVNGSINVVIGTHALLSDNLNFQNLGLIITDEQHRFGVEQRAILRQKNETAHLLVMSATPIPRTLALTLFGDLSVSKITEMPKGRQRVDTFVVDETYRERLNAFIEKQIAMCGQCYVVCPGIEKLDEDEAVLTEDILSNQSTPSLSIRRVEDVFAEMTKRFPNINIGCLHGKMRPAEKTEVMKNFANGTCKILVCTTIVEVGVNVPAATLIIVENADRFGLAQLHQLRGRVGRSDRKSYCILVSDTKNEVALRRLSVMKNVYNGFDIAEQDLQMRGPGDFFFTNTDNSFRQSGGISFHYATLCQDSGIMTAAFSSAKGIVDDDPALQDSDHISLRPLVLPYVKNNKFSIS